MKRIIALLVCVLMLVSMLPAVAFAAGDETTNPSDPTATDTNANPKYTVTVTNGTGGGSYAAGESVTITADAAETGKQFKAWEGLGGVTITSGSENAPTVTFKMPENNVTVTATYEDISAAVYTVSVSSNGFGTASARPSSGVKGTKVTLTATPHDGYALAGWELGTEKVTISNDEFVIGEADVAVKAIFMPINTPTSIDISVSTGSITYGETLEIYVNSTTLARSSAATFGTLTLTVNGCFTVSTPLNTLPYTWRIPVTGQCGFSTGTNTVSVKHTRQDGTFSSYSESIKVLRPSKPAPCPPSHYCCGHNHFTGKCVTVRAGEDVTFKVDLGCNETCQWYIDKGDGCGFVKIEGATCPSITVKDVTHKQDGYRYRCIVRNCCETIRNPIFTLNVASGQLYSPKTGDNSTLMMAVAAVTAACGLVQRKRED